MNEPEEVPCIKCGSDVTADDKFCRHCGEKDPGTGFSWDWKEQPPWGKINDLLRPYGCRIDDVNTGSDQYAARVVSIKA